MSAARCATTPSGTTEVTFGSARCVGVLARRRATHEHSKALQHKLHGRARYAFFARPPCAFPAVLPLVPPPPPPALLAPRRFAAPAPRAAL